MQKKKTASWLSLLCWLAALAFVVGGLEWICCRAEAAVIVRKIEVPCRQYWTGKYYEWYPQRYYLLMADRYADAGELERPLGDEEEDDLNLTLVSVTYQRWEEASEGEWVYEE